MKPDVLIVEDEPSILSSLEFILRHAGWTTRSVTDGEAALRAISMVVPRVVILDVMLPKQSGFDVLKKLRLDRNTRELPILILTAKGQQQDKRTAQGLGATGFITKPYANSEVVDAVRRLLGEAPVRGGANGKSEEDPER
ncbi:MAG TPA: response regulator [Devosia sp.]|nr:response regulator [Devosia sp.]